MVWMLKIRRHLKSCPYCQAHVRRCGGCATAADMAAATTSDTANLPLTDHGDRPEDIGKCLTSSKSRCHQEKIIIESTRGVEDTADNQTKGEGSGSGNSARIIYERDKDNSLHVSPARKTTVRISDNSQKLKMSHNNSNKREYFLSSSGHSLSGRIGGNLGNTIGEICNENDVSNVGTISLDIVPHEFDITSRETSNLYNNRNVNLSDRIVNNPRDSNTRQINADNINNAVYTTDVRGNYIVGENGQSILSTNDMEEILPAVRNNCSIDDSNYSLFHASTEQPSSSLPLSKEMYSTSISCPLTMSGIKPSLPLTGDSNISDDEHSKNEIAAIYPANSSQNNSSLNYVQSIKPFDRPPEEAVAGSNGHECGSPSDKQTRRLIPLTEADPRHNNGNKQLRSFNTTTGTINDSFINESVQSTLVIPGHGNNIILSSNSSEIPSNSSQSISMATSNSNQSNSDGRLCIVPVRSSNSSQFSNQSAVIPVSRYHYGRDSSSYLTEMSSSSSPDDSSIQQKQTERANYGEKVFNEMNNASRTNSIEELKCDDWRATTLPRKCPEKKNPEKSLARMFTLPRQHSVEHNSNTNSSEKQNINFAQSFSNIVKLSNNESCATNNAKSNDYSLKSSNSVDQLFPLSMEKQNSLLTLDPRNLTIVRAHNRSVSSSSSGSKNSIAFDNFGNLFHRGHIAKTSITSSNLAGPVNVPPPAPYDQGSWAVQRHNIQERKRDEVNKHQLPHILPSLSRAKRVVSKSVSNLISTDGSSSKSISFSVLPPPPPPVTSRIPYPVDDFEMNLPPPPPPPSSSIPFAGIQYPPVSHRGTATPIQQFSITNTSQPLRRLQQYSHDQRPKTVIVSSTSNLLPPAPMPPKPSYKNGVWLIPTKSHMTTFLGPDLPIYPPTRVPGGDKDRSRMHQSWEYLVWDFEDKQSRTFAVPETGEVADHSQMFSYSGKEKLSMSRSYSIGYKKSIEFSSKNSASVGLNRTSSWKDQSREMSPKSSDLSISKSHITKLPHHAISIQESSSTTSKYSILQHKPAQLHKQHVLQFQDAQDLRRNACALHGHKNKSGKCVFPL